MTTVTTRIEKPEEIVERRAQAFFDKYGRRPYGLVLKLVAERIAQQQSATNRFAKLEN